MLGQSKFSGDLFFKFPNNSDLCLMKKNQLKVLAHTVLPSGILDYYEITSVEQDSTEIHIHLDELMNVGLATDSNFASKGFIEAANVTDFPICDHKVILVIRRRR